MNARRDVARNDDTLPALALDEDVWNFAGEAGPEGPLRQYSRAIGRFTLLRAEEEVELSIAMEAGLLARERLERYEQPDAPQLSEVDEADLKELAGIGDAAKDRFIHANLRLVVKIAGAIHRGTPRTHRQTLLDQIQWGNIGLITAVERFDYTRGLKFSTHAAWWIRREIHANQGYNYATVLPQDTVTEVRAVGKERKTLLSQLGREPTDQEVARALDIDVKRLKDRERWGREAIFLANEEFDDLVRPTEPELDEVVANKVVIDRASLWIRDALEEFACLGEIEAMQAEAMQYRFGFMGKPENFATLGRRFGRNDETIARWHKKVINFLRNKAKRDGINIR
jgi:RNA polymerase primary sigma factor